MVGRLTVVKFAVLPRVIYRLNAIPIKIPTPLSAVRHKLILKFTRKCEELRKAKTILKK